MDKRHGILAAYAKGTGLWDGRHELGTVISPRQCAHCSSIWMASIDFERWCIVSPCPGPSYTKDTDALFAMLRHLHPMLVIIAGMVWVSVHPKMTAPSMSCEKTLQEALLSAVLAGIGEREDG